MRKARPGITFSTFDCFSKKKGNNFPWPSLRTYTSKDVQQKMNTITSNQIPLHVHAVFCHNNYYIIVFPLHDTVHCIYTSGARHDAHAYS